MCFHKYVVFVCFGKYLWYIALHDNDNDNGEYMHLHVVCYREGIVYWWIIIQPFNHYSSIHSVLMKEPNHSGKWCNQPNRLPWSTQTSLLEKSVETRSSKTKITTHISRENFSKSDRKDTVRRFKYYYHRMSRIKHPTNYLHALNSLHYLWEKNSEEIVVLKHTLAASLDPVYRWMSWITNRLPQVLDSIFTSCNLCAKLYLEDSVVKGKT